MTAKTKPKRTHGGVSPSPSNVEASTPGAAAHSDFTYHAGAVIRNPQVYTTFWGPNWSDATHTARATRLNQFVRDLLASNYMNVLSQYGVGTGVGSAGAFISTTSVSSVSSQINEAGIATVIQSLIDGGSIPEPPALNNNIVLIIFLDETIGVNQTGLRMCEPTSDNAFGFHFDFVTRAGHEFYYAVIPGLDDTCIRNSCPGGSCSLQLTQTQEQRITQVTSHEFAEMVTDPKFTLGWFGPTADENGDICNGQSATITVGANTWNVQRQYSKTDDENTNGASFCIIGAASPMALRADGPPPIKVKDSKDFKDGKDRKDLKDHKEKEKEQVKDSKDSKDSKDTKERKDLKDRKEKEATKDSKDSKDNKERKDLKDRKEKDKDKEKEKEKDKDKEKDKEKDTIKDSKDFKDTRDSHSVIGGAADYTTEQRLAALENTVAQLSHFIQTGQRPDLSMSPLNNEADLWGADLQAMSAELQQQADEAKRVKDDKDIEKLRDA